MEQSCPVWVLGSASVWVAVWVLPSDPLSALTPRLVLVAQKKQALAVAQSQFGPATDMSPPNSTPTPKETR